MGCVCVGCVCVCSLCSRCGGGVYGIPVVLRKHYWNTNVCHLNKVIYYCSHFMFERKPVSLVTILILKLSDIGTNPYLNDASNVKKK